LLPRRYLPGTPVDPTPDIAVGPFNNIQPYLCWACEAATIQSGCQTSGPDPGFDWSFSFGNGIEGNDVLANEFCVAAYLVGSRTPATGPEIAAIVNAEGGSTTIAPNTWVEINGANLAPAGDSRHRPGTHSYGAAATGAFARLSRVRSRRLRIRCSEGQPGLDRRFR
jgi:hypothetical protein